MHLRENHRGKMLFSLVHVKGTYCRHDSTIDCTFDHLAEVFVQFLHLVTFLSILSMTHSLEGYHYVNPTLSGVGTCAPPLR